MKKWKCTVCGYIHEGEEPPEKCPVCGADREKFVETDSSEETTEPGIQQNSAQKLDGADSASTVFEKIVSLIVGKHLHPISVHSPNGIVPVAVIFLFLAILAQSPSLASAAYFNMVAVLLSMPIVILTGYATWQKKYNGAKTTLFKIKIAASSLATTILIGLITWGMLQPDVLTTASLDRWLFLFWSLLLLALVGTAGHLGGKLVFEKKNKSDYQ